MYYDQLVTAWNALSGTTDERLSAINTGTAPGADILVPRGVIRQRFDNMADDNGIPVWEAIESQKDEATPEGIACRAALRLRDAPGDYPSVDMNSAAFQTQIAILVSSGILSQAQHDSIFALSKTTIPLWQSLGLTSIVTPPDLVAAGLIS